MNRGTSRVAGWARAGAIVLIGGLVSVVGPLGSAGAVEGVVTFPDVEAINPHVTAYDVTVTDAGGVGTLVARWKVSQDRFAEHALPHEGTASLPFAATVERNVFTTVEVFRCASATWSQSSCVWVDTSGWFSIYRQAEAQSGLPRPVGVSPRQFGWTYYPAGLGTTQWRLLGADGSVLQSGATPLDTGGTITLSVPPGTPAQQGSIELVSTVDGTPVGHLEGTTVVPVLVDGIAPAAPSLTLSATEFYPYSDDFRDSIRVGVVAEPGSSVSLTVETEPAGTSRHLTSFQAGAAVRDVAFNGRLDYKALPAGTYRLRAVSTDAAGNTSTVLSGPVTLRAERVVSSFWRTRIKATDSVIKRFVGPCGALREPASRGWRRSLAYVSGTKCQDAKKAYVQAVHATHIPSSVVKRYRTVKVSVLGGPSLRAPRGSYLVLGYYREGRKWDFVHRSVLRGTGVTMRDGRSTSGGDARALIHDIDTKPFIAWSTGLSSGSRYDVRSFVVEVTYDRLELPR